MSRLVLTIILIIVAIGLFDQLLNYNGFMKFIIDIIDDNVATCMANNIQIYRFNIQV